MKIEIPPVVSGQYTTTALNTRFQQIEDAFNDSVLWRDNPAEEPNQMSQALDMADFKIINLADAELDHEAVNLGQVSDLITEQILLETSRTLRAPDELNTLPSAASRLNKLLGFNNEGQPVLVSADPSTVPDLDLRVTALEDTQPVAPAEYGAVGDGVTDDTAAFATLEAAVSNQDIDLRGKTYAVSAIPTNNSYYNGRWALPERTVVARFDDTISFPGVRCTKFGGQLAQLKNSLCDPFEQFTGIAFLGDSITWGATLPENLSPGSDLTTLATRRDLFASPSFVNEFKRWVGRNYFDDATPTISNWAASSAGEAIATYTKTEQVYTNREPFTWTPTGTSTVTDTGAASSITGYQAMYAVGAGAGNEALIEFPFTGQELTVVFTCVDSDAVDYELIVDGISQGFFGTSSADGYTNMAFNQRSPHTFGYVRNKTIGIKIVGDGAPSVRRLRIEGIEIPKTVRITNQGISGSNSTRYRSRALTTDFLPDIAVSPEDNFSFLMLGTNDRFDSTWPQGINSFQEQMEDILNILDPLCETIVMCANSVGASNQAGKRFTMQQIRSVLYKMSNVRQHDFIDNYAIFDNADTTRYLADALHPNVLGHYMIYRNIVDALES